MQAPKHLSRRCSELWRRIDKEYALSDPEHELLRLALEALDRCEEARKAIEKDGAYVPDRYGALKCHPAASVERDSRLAAVRIFRELDLEGIPLPAPRRRNGA